MGRQHGDPAGLAGAGHWTQIADGGPDEVDAQAGAVRPRVPDRPECGASGHPGRLQRQNGAGDRPRKPDIAAAIEKPMAERAERTRLTADWVIDELRKLAGANMDACLKANPSGDLYLDLSDLTRDQTAALQLKRAALVDLGRHLGLFEIKYRIAGKIEVEGSSARETLHAR